jgi:CheY-like chemotaxis protein
MRGAKEFALLVADVGLPGGLNGRQLADAARELRAGLPVLLITGYAGGSLGQSLPAGMQLLRKPFSWQQLADATAAALADG